MTWHEAKTIKEITLKEESGLTQGKVPQDER